MIKRYLPDAWTSPFVYIKEREAENERESILQNHNGSRICINCMQSALLWICPRETSVRIQVFYIADRVWNNEVET